MKTYLAVAAGVPLLLVGSVAGTNYVFDPYLSHQWQTPQLSRLRQPVEKLNAWGKSYALAAYRPETIYLGNSRTELGLAVQQNATGRVFNAALSGATAGDALKMLAHAQGVARVHTVIWGIDAPSFSLAVGNSELEGGLIPGVDGSAYLARRFLLDLQRAVSIDMSSATLALIGGSVAPICRSSLAQMGQRDGACIRHRIDGWGGTSAVIGPRTREFLRGEGPTEGTLEALEQAVRRACDVRWRLYVNPTHAMTIDVLYWSGKGARYEGWLASLAAMRRRLRSLGCDARIYDFSGFNSITSEPVPHPGDRTEMQNFWETSHYREQVGDAILARLNGGPAAADGFGAELRPEEIEARIAQLRASRIAYLAAHPYEAGRAQRIAADHARGR